MKNRQLRNRLFFQIAEFLRYLSEFIYKKAQKPETRLSEKNEKNYPAEWAQKIAEAGDIIWTEFSLDSLASGPGFLYKSEFQESEYGLQDNRNQNDTKPVRQFNRTEKIWEPVTKSLFDGSCLKNDNAAEQHENAKSTTSIGEPADPSCGHQKIVTKKAGAKKTEENVLSIKSPDDDCKKRAMTDPENVNPRETPVTIQNKVAVSKGDNNIKKNRQPEEESCDINSETNKINLFTALLFPKKSNSHSLSETSPETRFFAEKEGRIHRLGRSTREKISENNPCSVKQQWPVNRNYVKQNGDTVFWGKRLNAEFTGQTKGAEKGLPKQAVGKKFEGLSFDKKQEPVKVKNDLWPSLENSRDSARVQWHGLAIETIERLEMLEKEQRGSLWNVSRF